jgi:hypothetical protein
MINKSSSPALAILWRITFGVAVLLLIITVMLAVKVQKTSSSSFTGYINNQSSTVYLRNDPSETGRTNAILNPGTEVYVDRSTIREDNTWYHVRTESGNGWIPEEDFSLNKP